ncbi:C-X-C motif chemokine 2 [Nelusetta ayraudi]|uniref:C-X-C motif chemokine 2 n=1 Tax=Nelusetta ayraudi TaxID=303726 RepID=UPI003F702799
MTKSLLLLAALTLCCCMASLHAFSGPSCQCLWTSPRRIPLRLIRKIEITPITGGCRRTEAIITRKNGSKVCVDPTVPWFIEVVARAQKVQRVASSPATASPTTAPPTASPTTRY